MERILLDQQKIQIILHRLCCQLIERYGGLERIVLIGLQPRGTFLLDRIIKLLKSKHHIDQVHNGKLDVTFFRDDFRRTEKPIKANQNLMSVVIENRHVILIDDVFFTGRSVRAALTAIESYGRPSTIELMVLVHRRFSRHLPIKPDYIGVQMDALVGDKVKVSWLENDGKDEVYLQKRT
ncbi:MAG: bifunctional pyr operon transcriptional regulator/uracil phosphoribosyltransferase PyrR [Flavobacteriaceae bacterium]|nr:bifunctional pyr operon transcriptional regulator/uracil phosphoribosyltransferase PyrR [Flavobacteriaceae bacterium]MCY4266991.1 bifunctional pyr operon transcriptional regulator/uracil phosphoribosyltransferase PyrR [Flavobacteriaceae bacterium]MCY4298778.1 bifunctional pyr operon transcriptional regulator/uracil phosphoribosyltransferase PyrR [Flavobacteriaceae bacterium]